MAVPTNDTYSGTPGQPIYGGRAAPTVGVQISSLTLVNESGTVQAADFVSPMFGIDFKAGDVPTGTYPFFTLADDTVCPATLGNYTTWPDGSLQFCSALIRVPASVPGSGTLTIKVKNGGSAPAASAMTTANLTAADLKVEVTGITSLTGLWTTTLNDGISVADDFKLVMAGPAGSVWQIGAEFRQGGSPHGQLYAWHHVVALQNTNGSLRGLRYIACAAQPWVEVTSPAAAPRVLTAVLKSGATIIRTLQGTNASEAATANITMAHYSTWHTAGATGKMDYVQGGGTTTTDCTIRVLVNKTYSLKSKTVPPYDLTQTITPGTAEPYRPYCIGGMTSRDTGNTGERPEIGLLPDWVVRHIISQNANDEQTVRVSSLASGGWRTCLRRRSSRKIVPTVDKVASYPGLGNTQPTYRFMGDSGTDINAPVGNTSLWNQEENLHHRASTAYYAYKLTGEVHHLNILLDYAAGGITSRHPNGWTFYTTSPITGELRGGTQGERDATIQGGATYKGGGTFMEEWGLRISAWLARDIGQAAAICPDSWPEKAYFKDVINNSFDAINDYNNRLPQSWRDAGLISFEGPSNTIPAPWMNGYLSNTVCHLASILATANAAQFRSHCSRFYSAQHALGRSVACFGSYHWISRKHDNTRIETAADALFLLESGLNFSTATSRFTVQAANPVDINPNGSWTPTNGDVIAFHTDYSGASRPFTGVADDRRMYVVNASGSSAQLSLTPGGAPITVTTNVTLNMVMAALQNFGPHYSFYGFADADGYTANTYGAMRHHEACGDVSIASARAAADALWAIAGGNFNSGPKNALAASYPA